jgi:predicted histidine transporter YuiF (NhaC family)
MESEREHREALAAAGHTGRLGAVLFCLLLAVVGGLLGSVVIAIALNALVPGLAESLTTALGTLVGGAAGVAIGLLKIVRGNREAEELVEDREWRRQLLRQQGGSRMP